MPLQEAAACLVELEVVGVRERRRERKTLWLWLRALRAWRPRLWQLWRQSRGLRLL